MARVALDAVTINDPDKGALPVILYDAQGNALSFSNGALSVNIGRNAANFAALASTIYSAAGNSQANNSFAGFYTELMILVNVTAIAGTAPTMSLWLQTKDETNNVWYDLVQLANATINAVGQYTYHMSPGITQAPVTGASFALGFGRIIALRWAIGGSASPSITATISLYGK
jgi:hypothetical protein